MFVRFKHSSVFYTETEKCQQMAQSASKKIRSWTGSIGKKLRLKEHTKQNKVMNKRISW